MAIFPTLTPSSRTFTPGRHPHSEIPTLNGLQVRVMTSNVVLEQQLRLAFLGLTEAQMLSIRSHYIGQQGRFLSFAIPASLLSGMTTPAYFTPTGYSWIYGSAPQVEDIPCAQRYNVSIELVTVPPEGANINGADFTVAIGLVAGAASARSDALGADLTVTASIEGGVVADNSSAGFDIAVPLSLVAGAATAPVSLVGSFINSDSTADTSHALTAPTHLEGQLLIAVLMWRSDKGALTPPSGWGLQGTYLTSILIGGNQQNLLVYTKSAGASEPGSYTWSAANSTRNCGLIVSVANGSIQTVVENYGNGATATVATVANHLNITVFTWIYAAAPPDTESYSQSGASVTQITDSPKNQARISGGHTTSSGIVTSTHAATNTDDSPNHGGICIRIA